MTKYHIDGKGNPAICKAKNNNCPLGQTEVHFDSKEDAQDYINLKSEQTHGLLPTVSLGDPSPPSKLSLPIEWHDNFLSCSTFDDFARIHGGDLMSSGLFKDSDDVASEAEKVWLNTHYEHSAKDLSELSDDQAVQAVYENVDSNHMSGWFREANSDYKPKIENAIITNPKLRNASLNLAHRVYQESTGNKVDFDSFVNSEIEVYRGGNFNYIESDVFLSYTFNKKIAQKFADKVPGSEVISTKVKIKDTLGSLQTDGEAELMVRNCV